MPRRIRRTVFTAISPVIVIVASAGAFGGAPSVERTARSEGGMVASSSPEATRVGAGILEAGGNAVDAAVAVGFALAVTHPSAGNIGGGGFMLVRLADGTTSFLDFREKAPAAADRDMYLDDEGNVIDDLSTRGHLASGVPGTVAGLWTAHSRFGSMEWEDLVMPAVELAENGFVVSAALSSSLGRLAGELDEWPGLAVFFDERGDPPAPGDTLLQPELAVTLRAIARKGPDGFYSGRTARLIAAEMRRGGGLITEEDLASYEAVEREPVAGSYRGFEIVSAPPPSSGGIVLLEILNILEGYGMGVRTGEARRIGLVIEAERKAYADRAKWLGDPDFVEIPVDMLVSKEYAARSRGGLEDGFSRPVDVESEETTHYSVMDAAGDAVAVTTTLNGSYGSYVVIPGAGFLMNNEMDDFSIKPGVANMYGLTGGTANEIGPGRRMLSSMAPTIVLRDGETWLVLGTPGGSTIITTVAQVIMNMVSAPRYHHQWNPDVVYCERGAFDGPLRAELGGMGYTLKERSLIGDVQMIVREGRFLVGISDPRREGMPMGTGEGSRN